MTDRPVFALGLAITAGALLAASPRIAHAQLVLDGEVPADDGARHFTIPFTVPEGTVEIEVRHDDLSEQNVLDWGLEDPNGFRGWGGGNEEPAIVGVMAASRSYVPGPIPAGEWRVVVGEAKLAELPARYHVEIDFRTTPTLEPQTERRPYVAVPALATGARWYAGDFHVHSRESGDARPDLDEIASFAESRGLDFVELSDHNTTTQLDFVLDAQSRHPELLFVPGMEYTTYSGHANAIGATGFVDSRVGPDLTIEDVAREFQAQGAIFSLNHPGLDLGDSCIGCVWEHELPPDMIAALEITTGGWSQSGWVLAPLALELWEELLAQGFHVTPVGGSDDHRAGVDLGGFQSPIGSPTTMVWAEELSVAAILEGVRRGRTVVKMQDPSDPMLDLTAGDLRIGDTIDTPTATLRLEVTGGMGQRVRFVRNGASQGPIEVTSDPFVTELPIEAPYGTAEDRWRAELWVGGDPRVITGHLWVAPRAGEPPPPPMMAATDDGGCGCAAPGAQTRSAAGSFLVALLAFAITRARARRRP